NVFEPVLQIVTCQSCRVGLEGIGQQDFCAGIDVGLMDGADFFRFGEVPVLVTFPGASTGTLQLGAHGAVHDDDTAGMQDFKKARHYRKEWLAQAPYFPSRPACARASGSKYMAWNWPKPPRRHCDSPNSVTGSGRQV